MKPIREDLDRLVRAWVQHTRAGFHAEYYKDVFLGKAEWPRRVRGYEEGARTIQWFIEADLPREGGEE